MTGGRRRCVSRGAQRAVRCTAAGHLAPPRGLRETSFGAQSDARRSNTRTVAFGPRVAAAAKEEEIAFSHKLQFSFDFWLACLRGSLRAYLTVGGWNDGA